MKKRWSLKSDDSGAALIAVVIILMVVGIIGTVVAQVTAVNAEMKGMESAGKKNFYSAEEVVDVFAAGLNDKAAVDMKEAYTEILSDYRNSMRSGHDIQKEFTRRYLNNLLATFGDVTYVDIKKLPEDAEDDAVEYQVGGYDKEVVKSALVVKNADGTLDESLLAYWRDPDAPKYHIDYENGTFTLTDLCIDFSDSSNPYSTVIHTNIVFHTPELNFRGSNIVKDFMRYSLIADNKINVNNAGISVTGSVYAGVGGIQSAGSFDASFTGTTIVTRGDIMTGPGAKLVMGSAGSKVWAENVRTEKGPVAEDPSEIVLNGSCYIADDLSLNANRSTVWINGSYYGYNFQKDYTAEEDPKDARFSSAIMINGRNNRLILENAQYLLISGRTYISRSSSSSGGQNDVPLGESVSVRSNQMAYYVPLHFLSWSSTPVVFTADGAAECSKYMGVSNILDYVDAGNPVQAYHYQPVGSSVSVVCYYLNFKNEQAANSFFGAYMANAANHEALNQYAGSYVDETPAYENEDDDVGRIALQLGDGLAYSVRGDMMYRDKVSGEFTEKVSFSGGGGWNRGQFYWNYADELARTYKCLEMYLEEPYAIPSAKKVNVEGENVRFVTGEGDERAVDMTKSSSPLLDNIMKWEGEDGFRARYADHDYVNDTNPDRVVVLTNGNYRVDDDYTGGLIIAAGNVTVGKSFSGLIIAGGEINFEYRDMTFSADEMKVSQMFTDDMALAAPYFADLFHDYASLAESVIGQVQVDKYLTYDQWTKTQE